MPDPDTANGGHIDRTRRCAKCHLTPSGERTKLGGLDAHVRYGCTALLHRGFDLSAILLDDFDVLLVHNRRRSLDSFVEFLD